MRAVPGNRALLASSALFCTCACARVPEPRTPVPNVASQSVVSTDVNAFWAAYDSARTTTDSLAQLRIVQSQYIDRATPGLRAFMTAREYTAGDWVGAIRSYPKFWASIRPGTFRVEQALPAFTPALARLRELYPPLRPATIYVTIGALRSSGTTQDSVVLIGAELVAGTPETDISEFTGGMHAFLERYFASRPSDNLIPLNVHEYVHTQQRGIGQTVLARAVREGSADFVTELVTGRSMPLPYMTYGPAHEAALREAFKAQMYTRLIRNWFYNQTSTDPAHVPDLGYYMGHAIARAYYERAAEKQLAIREMIELPFDDDAAVDAFLDRSGYFAGGVDKAALLRAYEARRPVVARVVPMSPDGRVDASITELRIEFSAVMAPYTGIDYGPGGKAQWPITSRVGFSADGRAYVVRVALKPGQTYSFVLEGTEGGGFRSADGGYPLRSDTVTFTTPDTNDARETRSRPGASAGRVLRLYLVRGRRNGM